MVASLMRDKHGYRLAFAWRGKRRTVRLHGGSSEGYIAKRMVEEVLMSSRLNLSPSIVQIKWLYRSDNRRILDALLSMRAIDERRHLWSASHEWLTDLSAQVSHGRMAMAERVVGLLVDAIGPNVMLGDIGEDQLSSVTKQLTGSDNTVAGQVKLIRQFFRWCFACGLIDKSPTLRASAAFHRSGRLEEVSEDRFAQLLSLTQRDDELRLALLLARWGGMRRAEILRLRVSSIDFDKSLIQVSDTKRAKTTGGVRPVPLFAELREPLLEAIELLPPAADTPEPDYLLPGLTAVGPEAMDQRLRRLARLHAVRLWVRPWQNLRATRESELIRLYGVQTASQWIGNSPRVALEHYAMASAGDWDKAVGK